MENPTVRTRRGEILPDGATVAVVGAGPAGCFFAIRLLRGAREQGRQLRVVILERKRVVVRAREEDQVVHLQGCSGCAGGISPRLADALHTNGLALPPDVIQTRIRTVTIQGEWKNIELRVPDDRRMYAVFRGSRPHSRGGNSRGLDDFLVEVATREGAELIGGEVTELEYTSTGKVRLSYRFPTARSSDRHVLIADFVALATGVNAIPGNPPAEQPLIRSLRRVLPKFRPPRVRHTLVAELKIATGSLRSLLGDAFFAEYGSGDFKIEMSSLIPKRDFLTLVLIGPAIDKAERKGSVAMVNRFLNLPHIRRILPGGEAFPVGCLCGPSIPIGAAEHYVGHRVAALGDLVVARLYKDGIYSAFVTAHALANTVLQLGVDRESLEDGYVPVVEGLRRDNLYGQIVFFLNRVAFGNRSLSRILYQAILTERKSKPEHQRRLAQILWKIASGDDSYRRILTSMFRPVAVYRILVGGLLVTIRNVVTEAIFGLKWEGFGRFPTGLHREDFVAKKADILPILEEFGLGYVPDVERMYSIRIRSTPARILQELGKFGDPDREFFRPRFVDVRRIEGRPNEVGSVVRYRLPIDKLSFSVELVRVVPRRRLVYRVKGGFAHGGILLFDLDRSGPGCYILSIYVGFNFPRGKTLFEQWFWKLFSKLFPGFAHDVVWNHSLCKLKHLVEMDVGRKRR